MGKVRVSKVLLDDDFTYDDLTLSEIICSNNLTGFSYFSSTIYDLCENALNQKFSSYLTTQKQLLDLFYCGELSKVKLLEDGDVTINEVMTELEENLLANTSVDLFPNHVVLLYQEKKMLLRAKTPVICHFSGSVLKAGSRYFSYRPMFYDVDDASTYVLKDTIKCEVSYAGYLPTNILEFEALNQRLRKAYSNGDEYAYNLSCNLRKDELRLLKLKKRG